MDFFDARPEIWVVERVHTVPPIAICSAGKYEIYKTPLKHGK